MAVAEKYADQEPMFGIEQEYTFFKDGRPLGWPLTATRHPRARTTAAWAATRCPAARSSSGTPRPASTPGLGIEGTNAEVMMGQWEFQIGILPPP